jgi:uncharacterized membrane protein
LETGTAKAAIERRWPSALALLGVAGMYGALPEYLAWTPTWLLVVLVVLLEVPALFAHRRGQSRVAMYLGVTGSAIVTMFLLASVVLLVRAALEHKKDPAHLLASAAGIWLANILVFAGWYWRLDAGGPVERERELGHDRGSFLFPQMNTDPSKLPRGQRLWTPAFIDYLFLAFNTSTAFSPTDTAVLSRWAKCLTMLQSLISLTVIAVLVGRAVNAL